MSFPPPNPASRSRLRAFNFALDDVVGWSKYRVVWEMGFPDEIREGVEWPMADSSAQQVWVRDDSGGMAKGFSFEPVPRTIPPLQPYQAWFYRNVRGQTWKLYLSLSPRSAGVLGLLRYLFQPRAVVEVCEYPTGAVF